MIEFAPLVQRHVLAVMDVRLEIRLVLAQRIASSAADRVGLRFELLEPGKLAAVVELDRRQPRVVVVGRRLLVTRLDAQRHLDEGVDPATLRGRAIGLGIGDRAADVFAELPYVGTMHLASAADRLHCRRIDRIVRRRVGQRRAVRQCGGHRPPLALEHRRAHHQRGKFLPSSARACWMAVNAPSRSLRWRRTAARLSHAGR